LALLVEDAATQQLVAYAPTVGAASWQFSEVEGDRAYRPLDVGLRTPNVTVNGSWEVLVAGRSSSPPDPLRPWLPRTLEGMRIEKLEVTAGGNRLLERGSEYGTDDCGTEQTFDSADASSRQQQVTLRGQTGYRIIARVEFRSECNEFNRFMLRAYGNDPAARIQRPYGSDCSGVVAPFEIFASRVESTGGIVGSVRCDRAGGGTSLGVRVAFFMDPEPPDSPPARAVGVERR
jgi:hypothetical protein